MQDPLERREQVRQRLRAKIINDTHDAAMRYDKFVESMKTQV